MLKRVFIITIATTLLTSCTWHQLLKHPKKAAPKGPVITSTTQRTAEFTKININGNIDVYLHTKAKFQKVVFFGETKDIANTKRSVQNGELYIKVGKGYPKFGRIKVDVYTRNLTAFTYNGSGNVFAKGVTSKCIDLDINNSRNTLFDGSFGISRATFRNVGYTKVRGIHGCVMNLNILDNAKVKLIGDSNVATINMSGNSDLTLYWVKSKTIRVKLKQFARAQLSGLTETLFAETWDKSRFDGRHLMSQNSFVKTHNFSEAYIAVVKNQHTLADDKSNIYYYMLPETKTDFMAKEGSVLDMRRWNRPFFKSHTRYNR